MIVRKPYITHYEGAYEQCDDKCEKCKHGLKFGEILYCGYVPGRCGLHEVLKGLGQAEHTKYRKCIFCKFYALDIKSKKCFECLSSVELDNYRVDPVIENEKWFRNIMNNHD